MTEPVILYGQIQWKRGILFSCDHIERIVKFTYQLFVVSEFFFFLMNERTRDMPHHGFAFLGFKSSIRPGLSAVRINELISVVLKYSAIEPIIVAYMPFVHIP